MQRELRTDEPLDRLARFSWDWAPTLCSHGCTDYHRAWSIVRLLEIGGALPAGEAFFTRELCALAQAGRSRVLVSGGADTGVTMLVLRAFAAAGRTPDLVFLDRCATPAMQNRLLFEHMGLQGEVLTLAAQELDCAPVDAIVAHSFLHLVPGEFRQGVLEAWARVLRPGGKVLMSTRLTDSEDDWVRVQDPERLAARHKSLHAHALAAGFTPAQADALADTALRFWNAPPGRAPALTEQNLHASFAAAGLRVESIERHPTEKGAGPVSLNMTGLARRHRAEVVATRG